MACDQRIDLTGPVVVLAVLPVIGIGHLEVLDQGTRLPQPVGVPRPLSARRSSSAAVMTSAGAMPRTSAVSAGLAGETRRSRRSRGQLRPAGRDQQHPGRRPMKLEVLHVPDCLNLATLLDRREGQVR